MDFKAFLRQMVDADILTSEELGTLINNASQKKEPMFEVVNNLCSSLNKKLLEESQSESFQEVSSIPDSILSENPSKNHLKMAIEEMAKERVGEEKSESLYATNISNLAPENTQDRLKVALEELAKEREDSDGFTSEDLSITNMSYTDLPEAPTDSQMQLKQDIEAISKKKMPFDSEEELAKTKIPAKLLGKLDKTKIVPPLEASIPDKTKIVPPPSKESEITINPPSVEIKESTAGISKEKALFEVPEIETAKKIEEQERYLTLETLGQGGMGVVQLVKDQVLGRNVALKRIRAKGHSGKISKKQKLMFWRLRREASITAVLEHPNIVPLYDMQKQDNGELYFTMRKIEGDTFDTLISKMRRKKVEYDEDRLLSIFFKVCDAISYAHSKKIVHRDLKPSNIMIGKFGEVYVLDWGIAKNQKEKETDEEVFLLKENQKNQEKKEKYETIGGMGTLGYMSPEQAFDAKNVKPPADIYSLGIILKQCFTLLSPLEELHQESATKKHDDPEIPDSPSVLPIDLQAIVDKATREDLEERYPSVEELVLDLERYRKNLKISARDYSLSEVFVKWSKRNRKEIGFVGGVCSLILFLLFYFQWTQQKAKTQQFREKFNQAISLKNSATNERLKKVAVRINKLLEAFNFLNDALALNPEHEEVRSEKYILSQLLIKEACKSEDYQLANYVLSNLAVLTNQESRQKEKLRTFIQEQKNKTLTLHLALFEEWKIKLKTPNWDETTEEDAVFEISKMQEKEILDKLLAELKASTQYFLKTSEQNNHMFSYYQVMIKALGRLQKEEAGPHLLKALLQAKNKVLRHSVEQRSSEDIQYMIYLANALADSKATISLKTFQDIRTEMEQNSFFWQRTVSAYRKIAKLQNLINLKPPKTADGFNERGLIYYRLNEIKKATEDFSQAIKLNKNFAIAYNNRALMHYSLGNMKEAIEDYSKAIDINPNDPDLAKAYKNRATAKAKQKDYEGAILDYEQALLMFRAEERVKILDNRGMVLLRMKKFDQAIEDFTKAIALNPNFEAAYTNRGFAEIEQGYFEKAKLDFEIALQLNERNAQAHLGLGLIDKKNQKLESAIERFTQAIQCYPKYAKAFIMRASAKSLKGNFEGAIRDCHSALIYETDIEEKVFILNELAAAEFRLERFHKALQNYNKAIKLKPNYSKAHYGIALILKKKGEFDKAIIAFSKALEGNPRLAGAYIQRGRLYQQKKQFTKALKDFDQALLLEPDNLSFYKERGELRTRTKDLIGAIKDFSKIIEEDPENFVAYANRGEILSNTGDIPRGIRDLKIAIQLNPKSEIPLFNLGLCYYRTNAYDEAIEAFERGLLLKTNPKAIKLFLSILAKRISKRYSGQKWSQTKEDLLRFRHFAPKNHPLINKINSMLKEVEEKLKK